MHNAFSGADIRRPLAYGQIDCKIDLAMEFGTSPHLFLLSSECVDMMTDVRVYAGRFKLAGDERVEPSATCTAPPQSSCMYVHLGLSSIRANSL